MTVRKFNSGFSLLELLFVVAIIATLVTFGLSTYKQRTVNQKVIRAASEMQQILQAGSAFFIEQGEWPVRQTPTGEEFEQKYLPFNGLVQNPWNLKYEYHPFSQNSLDAKRARLFQVETYVPTQNIATLVASRLPHSKVEAFNHLYVVKSQVALPGQSSSSSFQGLNVQKIGKVTLTKDHSFKKIKFGCPEGMKKNLFVFFLSVDSGEGDKGALAKFSIDKTECDHEGCSFALSMDYWRLCPGIEKVCWKPDAKATFQYIAYCMEENNLEESGG